jgi:hypothetical protein
MILGPLRQLDEAEECERGRQTDAARAAEAELNRLQVEEERVLDAYRTGVISPAQLGHQLEKIKAKRATLALQRSDSQPSQSLPLEQVETAVSDYCAQATVNLARFTLEEWRDFLRTIIETATFCGNHVRIHGRVPVSAGHQAAGEEIRIDAPILASATQLMSAGNR